MDDELLIEAVRRYPCLYNSKLLDFKVTLKKENAWVAIAAELGKAVDDCQKRWKVLRERYVKEIKKKKTQSGQGAMPNIGSELESQMEFLRDFIRHRKSEGNLTVSSQSIHVVVEDGSEAAEPQHADGEEEDSPTGTKFTEVAASSSFSATTPSLQNTRKRKRPASPAFTGIEKEILKELKRTETEERDEDELFGLSIGVTLKNMTPQQKALAKIRIQQIMYEIQFCNNQTS